MPRVVADANVLVSAALARSPRAPSVLTLDAVLDGRVELVTSPLLLREVAVVLARPRLQKYVSADEAARFVADLAAQTVLLVDPPGPHRAMCRDPRDDYLVALAEAGGAEAIVSGDLDLLAIDPAQLGVEVVTPRQFAGQAAASCRLGSSEDAPLDARRPRLEWRQWRPEVPVEEVYVGVEREAR